MAPRYNPPMHIAPSGTESRRFRSDLLLLGLGLALWVGLLGFEVWNPDRGLIFRDTPLMGLPNLQFLGESLRSGNIPFLHPRRGGGASFLADPQTSAMYPPAWGFALISTVSSPETGFRLHQFFHLWWLAMGWALIGRRLGGGMIAAFLTGATGAAAAPHLHALEWMQILAGMAWVPWGLLAALNGSARWFGLCLALGFVSGHAYFWVATPVLALAGIVLAPREARRRLLLSALILPLLTAPAWIGYLTLSAEVKPHGIQAEAEVPITAFEPKHLGTFFFPKLFRNFQFGYADGRVEAFKPWGRFGWARLCYIGILPLFALLIVGIRFARGGLAAGYSPRILGGTGVLIGGGLLMAMGIPMLAGVFPEIFKHMHHPSSFIHLTDWGLILLLPIGLSLLFNGFSEGRPLFLGLAVIGGGLSLLHQYFADLAPDGLAHPLWNFSWRTGWHSWIILIAVGMLLSFLCRTERGQSKAVFGAVWTLLILIHLVDLRVNTWERIMLTGARPAGSSLVQRFAPDGNGPENRLWMTPDLELQIIDISDKAVMTEEYVSWFAASGFPNVPAREGWYQFNDYNPPFLNARLNDWHNRLMDSRSPAELSALLRLSGIGWLLTTDEFPPSPDWKMLATTPIPGATSTLRLWRLQAAHGASVMSEADLRRLDRREGLATVASAEISVTWNGNSVAFELPSPIATTGSSTASHGAASITSTLLFAPLTPLRGWTATVDETPATILPRNGFGLAIPLPEGAKKVVCRYRQPLFDHSMILVLLGIIVLVANRRRRQVP